LPYVFVTLQYIIEPSSYSIVKYILNRAGYICTKVHISHTVAYTLNGFSISHSCLWHGIVVISEISNQELSREIIGSFVYLPTTAPGLGITGSHFPQLNSSQVI
jgi:hypothetical protein